MTLEGIAILKEWESVGTCERWPADALLEVRRMTSEAGYTDTYCQYEVWNREAGKLEPCGAYGADKCLCPEHFAFHRDCTVGPFTKSKRRAPVELPIGQAVRAMQKAYGFVSSFSGAFPLGKPIDAGKAPINPISRAEYDEWRRRLTYQTPEGAECCHLPAFWKAKPEGETPEAPAVAIEPEPVTITVPYVDAGGNAIEGMTVEIVNPVVIPEGATIIEPENARTVDAGPELTRAAIEKACRYLMEHKDNFRGTGIPGVLWNVGFRVVYQKREGTEKQIEYIRSIIAKTPDKYRPIMEGVTV